jgi:hypothetical protein
MSQHLRGEKQSKEMTIPSKQLLQEARGRGRREREEGELRKAQREGSHFVSSLSKEVLETGGVAQW